MKHLLVEILLNDNICPNNLFDWSKFYQSRRMMQNDSQDSNEEQGNVEESAVELNESNQMGSEEAEQMRQALYLDGEQNLNMF